MIKAILVWLVLCVIFGIGITAVRSSSGQERLAAAKTAGFAMLCSTLSLLFLLFVVILF